MCGISGIINLDCRPVPFDEIKPMNDLIAHLGPDDEGFYLDGNLALGHRRLAILDLTEGGHQPMPYKNDELLIVFNGEIYNYLEIREDLVNLGYQFSSNTDTEVILAAYAEWGERCVEKFNGMWAFALLDKSKRRLFCSRDRFGVKPFYYALVKDRLVFGSEIKQLLGFLPEVKANRRIVSEFIVSGFSDHTDETFFEGIYKLPQSSNMLIDVDRGTYEFQEYYDISPSESYKDSLVDALENYQRELQRSIMIRLRSDVQVGACLSGGLDSSTVCSLMSKPYRDRAGKSLIAIHAKSHEKQTDESAYAQMVADAAQLQLSVVEPGVEDFVSNIDEVVYTQEEPFGSTSIFMQYFVMKQAKALGCKVMLDGQGGDETLLGYEKYYPTVYIELFKKHGFKQAIKAVVESWKNNAKMSPIWILKYVIGSNFPSLRKLYMKNRTPFMRKEHVPSLTSLSELARAYRDPFRLQRHEIFSTNLPILLRYEDKNSMRHSVEARLPYIDYKALEYALNIDARHKIHGGWTKYILRQIVDPLLPKEVVWRKSKLGFNAPEATWLKSYETEMLESIKRSGLLAELTNMDVLERRFSALENPVKWRLFSVARWESVYGVS